MCDEKKYMYTYRRAFGQKNNQFRHKYFGLFTYDVILMIPRKKTITLTSEESARLV